MSAPATTRLDALTSLRFFAAMMIVLLHTDDGFGRSQSVFNLQQGVSFFYVLSGFILTLVYPRLDGWPAVRTFWRARFARVWPAYVFALLVGAWLVGYAWHLDTAVAYVAMVQSWIPLPRYYFSYNVLGWSVATEWFFYLVFPLLILDFERTWKWKLAASLGLVVGLAVLCGSIPMSTSRQAWAPEEQFVVNQIGVMYLNPLARLFEFVCGMVVALAWRRRDTGESWPVATATTLELAAIALCAISLLLSTVARGWVEATFGFAIGRWFSSSGSVIAFATLIYVIALGDGLVARALAWRPLVLGGEISFSIYLLHELLFVAYQARAGEFVAMPDALAFAIYIGVVWLAAYVAWRFVEMPARRWIVGGQLHGSSVLTQPAPAARLGAWLRPALALVALVVAGFAIHAAIARPSVLVRAADAQAPRRHSPQSCNLETADAQRFARGQPLAVAGSTVMLRGWFLSDISARPGIPASLRLLPEAGGAAWDGPIQRWLPRADVLTAKQATGEGDPGFAQRFDLSALPAGSYKLQLLFEDGGKAYDCNTGQVLRIHGG